MTSQQPQIDAVVFDLGGVLLDWDPRYVYRSLFGDPSAMEKFLPRPYRPALLVRGPAPPRPAGARGSLTGHARPIKPTSNKSTDGGN
jgi:hypothetical protein